MTIKEALDELEKMAQEVGEDTQLFNVATMKFGTCHVLSEPAFVKRIFNEDIDQRSRFNIKVKAGDSYIAILDNG